MELSSDLISQFVKATKEDKKTSSEATVYGTTVEYNGSIYVKLDGSDLLTPVSKTADVKSDERVSVMIKNHTATITGNVSSPAARTEDVQTNASKISEFEIIAAYRVTTEDLEATNAIIESLKAKTANLENMEAVYADIEELQAKYASLESVSAKDAEILNAEIESLRVTFGTFTDISTEELDAIYADIDQLTAYNANFTYVSADVLNALKANIDNLDVKKLDVNWANIDFANIDKATLNEIYAKSGLIENVTMEDGTVTGYLVGVTIKGDLIEAGTLVADKLVILGEDGLYYKLNTNGITTEAEQTDYNSLNGSIITAKSITATKISVSDLVAFDATIGGFHITDGAIYSGVKETIDNTASGLYLGKDGQLSLGDETNYLRYYKDADGNYKLEISADSILFGANDKSSIDDIKALTEHIKMGTWTDSETQEVNPSIELSEGDSDFKQVITNKAARIMEGETIITEMDTEGVETENVTVRGEIRQGQWVWMTHGKGNLGLMWKEVVT